MRVLGRHKRSKQDNSHRDTGDHEGVGPAHRATAVRFYAIGEADQQYRQSNPKGQVTCQVELLTRARSLVLEAWQNPIGCRSGRRGR